MYIIVFTLLSGICPAQPANKIQFNHFSTEHGLSQTVFTSIFQDSKGYMWFGSFTGLLKFDGYKFISFNSDPRKKNSIPDNSIKKICEDSAGNIWMVHPNNPVLTKYSTHTESFVLYRYNINNISTGIPGYVSDLATDKQGKVWIGTDSGLRLYDAASDKMINLQDITTPDTLCDRNVQCLMIDHNGLLWIGTDNGINIYDPYRKKLKLFDPPDKNYKAFCKEVHYMLEASDGDIWIAVWSADIRRRGIYRYTPATGISKIYRHAETDMHSFSPGYINALIEDKQHNIWVGMYAGGISIYQAASDNFVNYRSDAFEYDAVNSDHILSMIEDRSGIIWIGTNGGGLNTCYFTNKKFTVFQNYDKEFRTHYPLSLYKDQAGKIYVTTFGAGIIEFDPITQQFRSDKNNAPDNEFNYCYGVFEDSEKNFWGVSFDEGLYKLDRKTNKFLTVHSIRNNRDTTLHNVSNCIAEDKNKRLWIGTDKGLKCYDLSKKTYYAFETLYGDTTKLSNTSIVNLYCDPDGVLWIGGVEGLYLFNTKSGQVKTFRHDYNNPTSLSFNRVTSFYDDGNGIVWIGTEGGGLNEFDKKSEQFISYTTEDGLPGNSIYGIINDDHENLWLSTNKGLCKFTPPSVTNGKAVCRNYDMSDGLPGNEYNYNTCAKGNDGTLYFASTKGLVVFKPAGLKDNQFIPPVVITGFSVFNNSILPNDSTGILKLPADETKEITLSYKQNDLSFTFSALSYVHPEKNQYAYMLEGHDKDWIYTDASKRFANYTNLDAGEFTFRVKASNNDGVWNEEGASIKLIINPPYWQTWWFRLLCVLTGGLIVFAIYYSRMQKKRDIRRIRNKIAGDLHDDLGATLSSISIMSELVNQQIKDHSPRQVQYLKK